MLRDIQNIWKNLSVVAVVTTLALFLLMGCSGGVKEGQAGNLGWSVSVVEGSKQIALPKRPYANPLEISVMDPSGQPVIDASVEFRLVDDTLVGKENITPEKVTLTPEKISELWKSTIAKQSSSNPAVRNAAIAAAREEGKDAKQAEADIEERVGRIDQFEARTNAKGRAKVWVVSPTFFNKTVVVLARAGAELSASYSYGVLQTSDLKSGARLFLSTNNQNKEKAGSEFDIWITIADSDGKIASSFEGYKK